ncbi:NAD(P)-binding domain,Short-chain dehydrogenase/reductase SDR [Cinara cedri]|uniref:NAD(P)-binding domain,Short-chain dehydrogenase/reductase SDR n=1 Tax=Cinara cedri TaxID=506608 RepID=A0A5E4NMA5_9HEMI|nr:NAD(P)-binding domain,Short-chain dehydrogenase/reductase SDR [Cinara cedri]
MWYSETLSCLRTVNLVAFASYTVVVATVFLVTVKLYTWMTTGVYRGTRSMKGKTVIVTGCNSGIGKETAKDLAKRGAKVIMACRNMETGTKAKDEIINETGNSNVELMTLDLSSLNSVRQFAAKVNKQESRLDVLVNNAGVANTFGKKITEDGLEMTMATNQYGPFLLTHLLLPLLKKTASSRIVIVASDLYKLGKLNLTKPNPTNQLPAYLYYVSKYANIMFSMELARKLKESNSGITCNCLHPGMIDSGIWRNVPIPFNWGLLLITKTMFKTTEQGAQTSIYLSVSEDVTGVTGKYFKDCKEAILRSDVLDEVNAKKYWEICEQLVKLQPDDPRP